MSTGHAISHLLDLARQERPGGSAVESVVAPAALLLALRWADGYDAEQAAIAAFNGESARLILPLSLRWSAWRQGLRPLAPTEVAALWSGVREVLGLPLDPRISHHKILLPSGRLLTALASWAEQFPFDTPDERRQAGESFTELVLQAMDSARFGAELVTPRQMGRLMIALADPRPSERIYDPCFGTGGLLVDAAETLWNLGRDISPGEWTRAQRVPMFGVERDAALHLVAFVRLLLAGVRPALELGDALERDAAGRHHDQGFDCVLADPPWGAKVEGGHLYDFPIKGRTSENLYLQHAIRSLRPGGRAVVAVPPGLLFRGGPDYELRRWLLTECRVELVLRLPPKSLRNRTITPNLLVVRRAAPTESVRFVDLVVLPESARAGRTLAQALSDNQDVSPNVSRTLAVAELLKADARLVVPSVLEAAGEDELKALGQAAELMALGEVADLIAGIPVVREAVLEKGVPSAVPLVRVGDLIEGSLRMGQRYLRPQASIGVSPEKFVRHGDILLSVSGTIGKVLLVREGQPAQDKDILRTAGGFEPFAVAQKGLVIVRPYRVLDAQFLQAVLASDVYQALLRRLAHGDTVAHLSLKALHSARVPVPPLAVQKRVLQRLADRPGDAVEALMAVLSSGAEDPLARLLRSSTSIGRLLGEGLPEPEELSRLALETLSTLRSLRNEAVHGAVDVEPNVLEWLSAFSNLPRELLRRGSSPRYESLEATKIVLEKAMSSARLVVGVHGRQLARLTERLLAWVDASKAIAAKDFRIDVECEFEEAAGDAELRVWLHGTAALHDFFGHLDIDEFADVSAADFLPGDCISTRLPFPELNWIRVGDELHYPCEFIWSGRRVDDEGDAGTLSVVIKCRQAIAVSGVALELLAKDLGVSPYITGDVVESPEMFFGRKAIINDIKAHLGGGTKVILLEGNRRTGKTSILRQLQRPEMGLLDSWIPVECSFQGAVGDATRDGVSTEGIFRLLVRDIGIACAKAGMAVPLPGMDTCDDLNLFRFKLAGALNAFFKDIDPYEALQIYVGMVTEAVTPRRLLLMLDEFDKLQVGIDNGVTSPQVPENIRNLLQTRPTVSAIITGSKRLKRLREEYWSALFGFGHSVSIEPLTRSEVDDLVRQPVSGRMTFDDSAVAEIAELTAKQPFLVQSLCARVFELAKHHNWRLIRSEQVLEGVTRMVRNNEHFQALWSYAETDRRRYLLCLCNRLSDGSQRVNADLLAEHLAEAGIMVPVESVDDDLKALVEIELVELVNIALGPHYQIAVPLMRRWMDVNVDGEAQRRRAQLESKGSKPTVFADDIRPIEVKDDVRRFDEGSSIGQSDNADDEEKRR